MCTSALRWFEKRAVKTHRLLKDYFGGSVPSETACGNWFRQFQSGDCDADGKKTLWNSKEFANQLNVPKAAISIRLHGYRMNWPKVHIEPIKLFNFLREKLRKVDIFWKHKTQKILDNHQNRFQSGTSTVTKQWCVFGEIWSSWNRMKQ